MESYQKSQPINRRVFQVLPRSWNQMPNVSRSNLHPWRSPGPPPVFHEGGWIGKRFHSDLKIASIEAMKETNL